MAAGRVMIAGALAAIVLLIAIRRARGAEDEELDGPALYREACASCHGADGRGATGTAVTVPLPDFTDCGFNTREPDSDWGYVVARGGAAAGLSPQMPAFTGALTPEETHRVLAYVRSFCTDGWWPRGELNFRRPIFTGKAFPEDEAVATQSFIKGPGSTANWVTELSIEQRIGARGQFELTLPIEVRDPSSGSTEAGVGDLSLNGQYVLYASLQHLTIVAASLELVLPSGDRDRGLGDGTVTFEPSLLAGTGLLDPIVLQAQLQGVAPVDEHRADSGVRFLSAASYPLGPLRRDWWPTLEFEARQNVSAGESEFFLTPEIYKAIRTRGHVAMSLGVQLPIGGRRPFDYNIVGFLLWEYGDGGLWW